jgi:hypothetical protein
MKTYVILHKGPINTIVPTPGSSTHFLSIYGWRKWNKPIDLLVFADDLTWRDVPDDVYDDLRAHLPDNRKVKFA